MIEQLLIFLKTIVPSKHWKLLNSVSAYIILTAFRDSWYAYQLSPEAYIVLHT